MHRNIFVCLTWFLKESANKVTYTRARWSSVSPNVPWYLLLNSSPIRASWWPTWVAELQGSQDEHVRGEACNSNSLKALCKCQVLLFPQQLGWTGHVKVKCYRRFVSCYLWVYWLSILCPYMKCFDVFIRSCIFSAFEKKCWFFLGVSFLYTRQWDSGLGFWIFPLSSLSSQSIETAFTSNLSNYLILEKCWLYHPTDLLQWVLLCSVGLQLGGARVQTDQNLKFFRGIQKLEQHLWHMLMLKTGYAFLIKIFN